MKNKILLVEDEENLSEIITLNLQLEGHTVDVCSNGKEAILMIEKHNYNLLILDVMLPEISGFEICEEIRKTDQITPVLFLTAKSSGEDRVKGLKLGADDYLTKPFNLEELLLRVNNLLKRTTKEKELTSFYFGNNFVNFQTYEIKDKNGNIFSINKKELQLLKLLIEKNNMVVSRDEILDKIWGDDVYPSSRTIDNYILAFRKYFEQNPRQAKYFHSIRGVGYKFTN
ncbi:MAG: response regulator transcription factor [Bacteroidota bacterium]|nr:response regulator transcription factor [Bacteroidota bacterium]